MNTVLAQMRNEVAPVRVAVIGGGVNCEHEVSLRSAAAAANAMDPARYRPMRITLHRDNTWAVDGAECRLGEVVAHLAECDVVLPLIHGAGGEDGTLAALCDLLGVPYVGSGVRAGAIAMDKAATKALAATVGVATAPGYVMRRGEVALPWTGPVVVKPVASGSSFGVTMVEESALLGAALDLAWEIDSAVLVEQRIEGREIGLTVCDWGDGSPSATPLLEVLTEDIFDSKRKYDGSAAFRVVDDVPADLVSEAQSQATRVYRALGCAGPVRVDFFLTVNGWCLNEVNTVPGLTEHSQVPQMYAAMGVSYKDLIDRMVMAALPGERLDSWLRAS